MGLGSGGGACWGGRGQGGWDQRSEACVKIKIKIGGVGSGGGGFGLGGGGVRVDGWM